MAQDSTRDPWYFRLDEWGHRNIDRLFPWAWYWSIRCHFCRYVDRRLGVLDDEMDRA